MYNVFTLCSVLSYNTDGRVPLVLKYLDMITYRSDDFSEGRSPPAPVAVGDNVGRVGDEWSVVRVELARVVGSAIVVRVTDR